MGDVVGAFYDQLPFNFYESAEASLDAIRRNPVEATYPDLHELLLQGKIRRVYEFGCGAGWLANSLALHYGVAVVAIDFTARAIARAKEVTELLGLGKLVKYHEGNLFDFDGPQEADLVLSMGVLHHTGDAAAAFQHAQGFVRPGGHVYVGLYHLYGRREFLRIFRDLLDQEGEQAAFAHYKQLDGVRADDDLHIASWFRDQVLHPHETLHTLAEFADWCQAAGLTLCSTSINRFGPMDNLDEVLALEPEFEAISHQANVVEQRYFPGFFVAMARKES